MAKKNQTGTICMFLETDLEHSAPFDESAMSEIQRQVFDRLHKSSQDKIREGYGAIVRNVESGETIAEFNMDSYRPPKSAIERFAKAILPQIKEYYRNRNGASGGEAPEDTEGKE